MMPHILSLYNHIDSFVQLFLRNFEIIAYLFSILTDLTHLRNNLFK